MDIEATKIWAGEHVVRVLCSGKEFRGLGETARYLVMVASRYADENAKFISASSARTPEDWQAMEETVTRDFVIGILGMGDTKRTPVEAAAHLVDTVWDTYIAWAEVAGRDADVSLRS